MKRTSLVIISFLLASAFAATTGYAECGAAHAADSIAPVEKDGTECGAKAKADGESGEPACCAAAKAAAAEGNAEVGCDCESDCTEADCANCDEADCPKAAAGECPKAAAGECPKAAAGECPHAAKAAAEKKAAEK